MTPLRFLLAFLFLGTSSFFFFFFRNRLRKLVPSLVASAVEKFEQILLERFGNNFKQSFKGHKNSE